MSTHLLTEQNLAERWRMSVKTLRNWRVSGHSLAYVKVGRCVRYRVDDIEAFESAHSRKSTSQVATK